MYGTKQCFKELSLRQKRKISEYNKEIVQNMNCVKQDGFGLKMIFEVGKWGEEMKRNNFEEKFFV